MAFVLTIVGLLMIVTGAKGTYAAFGKQVASDFTGDHNFTYWLAAFGIIGAVGYIDALKTFSRLFMSLILISMVLANKGFFAQFTAALKQGPVAPVGTGEPATNSASSNGNAGADGKSLKQSLQTPGGGGFWSFVGIPSPFGN